jgi:hypothetical protein
VVKELCGICFSLDLGRDKTPANSRVIELRARRLAHRNVWRTIAYPKKTPGCPPGVQ